MSVDSWKNVINYAKNQKLLLKYQINKEIHLKIGYKKIHAKLLKKISKNRLAGFKLSSNLQKIIFSSNHWLTVGFSGTSTGE